MFTVKISDDNPTADTPGLHVKAKWISVTFMDQDNHIASTGSWCAGVNEEFPPERVLMAVVSSTVAIIKSFKAEVSRDFYRKMMSFATDYADQINALDVEGKELKKR